MEELFKTGTQGSAIRRKCLVKQSVSRSVDQSLSRSESQSVRAWLDTPSIRLTDSPATSSSIENIIGQ